MLAELFLYSLVAAGSPQTADNKGIAETLPRNLNEAAVAQIQDDDLKQAAEWLDKAEQSKENAPIVQKAESNLKEEEMPVLTSTDSIKKLKRDAPISRVVASLGILLAMMLGTWFFYKKWAKRDRDSNKNTRIKVLTQHFLGPRKSLAIVRVAGESILIGVTDQNITMIKSLALLDEDIPAEAPVQFSKSLEKAQAKQTDDIEDEFSVSKIKDFVSDKLKGMKEI